MNIILVGNGSSVLEKSNGSLIDSFDIVVRFNWYHIKGFEKNVGTKTDYWFTTVADPSRMEKTYQHIYEHSWNWNNSTDQNYQMFINKGLQPIKTTKTTINEIQTYVGSTEYFHYSTGAIAIWMMLKEHSHIVLTGFDWWEKNNKHHYGDNQEKGHIHNPEKEFTFINKLIEEKKVSFLKDDWYKKEDERYSHLYSNNYPIGNPMGIVTRYKLQKNQKCLDLGCGRATLSNYFTDYTGVDVSSYIIEQNKKTKKGIFYNCSLDDISMLKNNQYEVIICSDVMEHIPENKLDGVLYSISKMSTKMFYFDISLRKSVFLDSQGNNLHLSVLSKDTWLNYFQKYFTIISSELKNTLLHIECSNK